MSIRVLEMTASKDEGVIAFDLDGVIAKRQTPFNEYKIGSPIKQTINRIKRYLKNGKQVVILTARVNTSFNRDPIKIRTIRMMIERYCITHIGKRLPVTSEKHPSMTEIHDDRAKQYIPDTGIIVK